MMAESVSIERFLARDDERVAEAGRTILLSHGGVRPRAVVLLHGLTASPRQFVRYARDLYARGHNVLVPRFPRHGYSDRLTGALAGLTDEHLRAFARESLDVASALGERITVAGISAGGTLALWMAQHQAFDRAVAISPFLGVAMLPGALTGTAMRLLLRLPNRFVWWDPIRRDRLMPEHGYPRYPTHALAYLYRISDDVLRDGAVHLPQARNVRFVINTGEASVSNRAIRALSSRWKQQGADVEEIVLRNMPPSHDIVEPERNVALAARVYPEILEAIDPRA
jgi:pimeloyl-ACP methyl ester carboxylesterase